MRNETRIKKCIYSCKKWILTDNSEKKSWKQFKLISKLTLLSFLVKNYLNLSHIYIQQPVCVLSEWMGLPCCTMYMVDCMCVSACISKNMQTTNNSQHTNRLSGLQESWGERQDRASVFRPTNPPGTLSVPAGMKSPPQGDSRRVYNDANSSKSISVLLLHSQYPTGFEDKNNNTQGSKEIKNRFFYWLVLK